MDISGFLFLNKPCGVTSAQLLNQLKKRLPKGSKVGHAGTLDSFANGLLIAGISRAATKNLPHIMQLDKQYRVTAQLGITTNTLDTTGVIQKQQEVNVTPSEIAATLHSFCPSYLQQPPLFSAKKYKGVRLSDLVRKGVALEQLIDIAQKKAKKVCLSQLNITEISLPNISFEVIVSHGTYIRALVHDLGMRLNIGAATKSLTRTAIGSWKLSEAHTLQSLTITQDLISIDSIRTELNR